MKLDLNLSRCFPFVSVFVWSFFLLWSIFIFFSIFEMCAPPSRVSLIFHCRGEQDDHGVCDMRGIQRRPVHVDSPKYGALGVIVFTHAPCLIRFLQYDHQTAVVLPIVQGSPNYQVSTQKLLFYLECLMHNEPFAALRRISLPSRHHNNNSVHLTASR